MNAQPFIAPLRQLNLNRSEENYVKAFIDQPSGRSFLPVADLLATHGFENEAVELLSQGVRQHPTFTLARVALASHLFQRGLYADADDLLTTSPVVLDDNAAAQKLLFKLALIAGDIAQVEEKRRHLRQRSMLDDETRLLSDAFVVGGIEAARRMLCERHDLKAPIQQRAPTPLPDELSEVACERLAIDDQSQVDDFEIAPLKEVFQRRVGAQHLQPSEAIEFDSVTLAEIYERQKHFAKALNVYERLVRVDSGNAQYRAQIKRLQALQEEQRRNDYELDPELMGNIEQIEVIDRQMQFYRHLLDKLS
jgi:tetratricopeptide (TPR) repeat protein